MLDTLSIVPLWGLIASHMVLGVVAARVQIARGFSRSASLAVLVLVGVVFAGAQAVRWDLKTRESFMGGPADSNKRLRLEAQGTAQSYNEWRQRWLAMSQDEKWSWRITMFGVTCGPLLVTGVPAVLWMTRRPLRPRGS